jgi:PilZ domain-containing protein
MTDATRGNPAQDELAALERERERIDAQLRTGPPPTIEAMLRDERRWVERRKRALERVPVSSRAVLRAGRFSWTCHVRDVSAHGVGVDAEVQPRVGETVRLELMQLEGTPALDAIVRHVTGVRVGLEFVPSGEASRAAAAALVRRFAVRAS